MKTQDICKKATLKNDSLTVNIEKVSFDQCQGWFYDETLGEIRNQNGSFFQITGIKKINHTVNGDVVVAQQPIILQNEIGFLGIISKKIDGEMKYLMQYKIEPGNKRKIQISPTIQATKSNFTKQHGGKAPLYLEYFENASKYKIVVDQIQSEQSSRFLGKRNRNIIIELNENQDIEVSKHHDWMTLKQIKELMRFDNFVNMDTRTVLSCLPYAVESYSADELKQIESEFSDKALFKSIFYGSNENQIPSIYHYINNYKMFDDSETRLVPLNQLEGWSFKDNGKEFSCDSPYSFNVIFCDVEIEDREVRHWYQPLFAASGIATFALFTCVDNGVKKFLVKCRDEIGCFDKIEIGPSVQREAISSEEKTVVDLLLDKKLSENSSDIKFDTLLSEEGGRFYQEENRNIILEIDKNEIDLPDGYFWCDYKTLNTLAQVNNSLNIQLRNLLSVLEF